jgi:hypothetical protein
MEEVTVRIIPFDETERVETGVVQDGLVLRNQIGTGFGERKYGLRGLEFVTVSPMFFDPENDANQLRDLETRMRKESGAVVKHVEYSDEPMRPVYVEYLDENEELIGDKGSDVALTETEAIFAIMLSWAEHQLRIENKVYESLDV